MGEREVGFKGEIWQCGDGKGVSQSKVAKVPNVGPHGFCDSVTFCCMHTIFYFSINGDLYGFHVWATVNSSTMKMEVLAFLSDAHFI